MGQIFKFLILGSLVCSVVVVGAPASASETQIAQLRWDSPAGADVFVSSLDDQVTKVKEILNDAALKRLIDEQRELLLKSRRALMIQSFGCSSHAGDRSSFHCELRFGSYGLRRGTVDYGRVYAQSVNGQVSILDSKFSY
jgi:hypothetical protein